jgi:protein arginine kinase activator
MHPSLIHVGKAPRYFVQKQKKNESRKFLQEQLQKAINEEEYEKAAQLRDEIVSLQQMAAASSSSNRSQDRDLEKLFPIASSASDSSIDTSLSSEISE